MSTSFVAAALLLVPMSIGESTGTGAVLPDFLLEAADGARVSLQGEQPGRTLTVLAFLDRGCPVTQSIAPRLGEREREYRDRGVRFLGIACEPEDASAALADFGAATKLEFPLLRDPRCVVAEQAGASRSGEVLVLDGDFRVVYRGAPDDRFEGGTAKASAQNDYLVDAIESALAGETIDPAATEAAGAALARKSPADVTFHRDVAPILWKHCVECHRPGQIGPMSFLDVDEATGWAPTIAEVVGNGRMPPWHADPRHGRFRNERRLTETDKRTLELWAATGAKAGDPKQAPPTPRFADPEWRIGKPDFVFELPADEPIAAEGVLPYRYVPLDPQLTEDVWVQAVEVRPSARNATHHVIAYLLPPGMSPKEALRRPENILLLSALGGYAPGSDPVIFPDGEGTLLAKGSTLLFELHYTPVGKATSDRTKVGVRRSRAPVTRVVQTGAAMNFSFKIPPRHPEATFQARHRFTSAAQLLNFTPHMHMRGKAMRYELERADGTKQLVLDVPRYDFNWQLTYHLATPIEIAKGDTLRVTGVFDNSQDNPFNPDPDAWVTWGDQSFEEMLIGYFDYLEPEAEVDAGDAKE